MTWEEIAGMLIAYSKPIHVVRGEGQDTVSLQLVPVAWFICAKWMGTLNMGVYEGDDHRLVGTHSIPFAELTPEFLKIEVDRALAKQAELLAEDCGPESGRWGSNRFL
ncbi:MAG: hypothetical protein JWL59_5194 [Chthoniobacteraceae bacterium]|nr:hypothetical protein [Chthoniobacteraceae bacterium]